MLMQMADRPITWQQLDGFWHITVLCIIKLFFAMAGPFLMKRCIERFKLPSHVKQTALSKLVASLELRSGELV